MASDSFRVGFVEVNIGFPRRYSPEDKIYPAKREEGEKLWIV